MEKKWILCLGTLVIIHLKKSSAKVSCKYPEVPVRLGPRESHMVPICPGISSGDSGTWSETLKQNTFTCDALICNRCRCDVKMGYKLSNDTDQAECVMFCPKSQYDRSNRQGCVSSRTAQPCV